MTAGFCLLLSACQPSPQAESPAPTAAPPGSIVVMPVDTPAQQGHPANAKEQKSLSEGGNAMAGLLQEYFTEAKVKNVRFLDQNQIEASLADRTGSRQSLARKVATQLNSDAVLLFTLRRYSEREGTDYAAAKPASIAFDYRLLAAGSGETICAGSFDEEEKSLLENILSFDSKRGLRWRTAREFAKEALGQKLSACPPLAADK